ncbi:MAG: thiazole synthase, partial [Muribaculaceae bacterium]
MDILKIGNREFQSRLFVGTGKFPSNQLMLDAILASESEMITIAMKRIELNNENDDMLSHINREKVQFLPNTSGVRNAEEAIFAAKLSRDCFGTNFI